MKEKKEEITDNLCRIIGTQKLDSMFGEPFIGAFSKFMSQGKEEVYVASYTCSLFLSVILNKFPTEKLHTFVHFTKEHYKRFSFNCKMYEDIFSNITEENLKNVTLLSMDGSCTYHTCSKQDIFEAFDFYTNT